MLAMREDEAGKEWSTRPHVEFNYCCVYFVVCIQHEIPRLSVCPSVRSVFSVSTAINPPRTPDRPPVGSCPFSLTPPGPSGWILPI